MSGGMSTLEIRSEGPLRGDLASVAVDSPLSWLGSRRTASRAVCSRIPFSASGEWRMVDGRLEHRSGRFFSIAGLRSRSRAGGADPIEQPIIVQPEIGILGFLAQRRNGSHRLLVQAKYEPGNTNGVQMAPTLQATLSNYRRVHGGREPAFLDLFIGPLAGRVVVDRLESEQGTRFLHKRNRNLVVELDERVSVPHDDSFRWIALPEIADLLSMDNVFNTDARSVLSCLPLGWLNRDEAMVERRRKSEFGRRLIESARAGGDAGEEDLRRIEAWCSAMKRRPRPVTETVPLAQLAHWKIVGGRMARGDARRFSVDQIRVEASGREVDSWDQPIVSSRGEGRIGFLCQQRKGRLRFLVQACAEPGLFDGVELTATVQREPGFEPAEERSGDDPFAWIFDRPAADRIRLSVLQSEEGGRFFNDQNRYLVVEVDEDAEIDAPDNYRWMTLAQMTAMRRFNHLFTNEARSLIACLMV